MKPHGKELIRQMKRDRREWREHLIPHCGICGRAFATLADVLAHQHETNHLIWL